MFVKFVRCLGPALILQTVVAATELGRFGRVGSRQTNPLPVNFERVTVDDGCLPGDRVSKCRRRNERDKRCDQETLNLAVGIASMGPLSSNLARGTTYMMAFIGIKLLE